MATPGRPPPRADALVATLLDVAFDVRGPGDDLEYARGFLGAYRDDDRDVEPSVTVTLSVRRGTLPGPSGPEIAVHRSKHPYWNFDGRLVSTTPRVVSWPSRGVALAVRHSGRTVEVVAGRDVAPVVVGEAVFHAMRSLALYVRDGRRGNLLHASAVDVDGRAVLFCGGVNAGKTTLLLEAVLRGGAEPLGNDRVLVSASDPLVAVSWPSYCSYAEGTLRLYPALAGGAHAYERDDCGYRTQTWGGELRASFTKEHKRAFPMQWFVDTTGRKYVARRPLGAIALTRVDPALEDIGVTGVDLDDDDERAGVAQLLEREGFDRREPSFCAWHGLELPAAAPPAAELVDRLRRAGVAVVRLRSSVAVDRAVPALLSVVRDAWSAARSPAR